MIQELINTFEELKKYDYFISIGKKGYIILKFQNEHFYHLIGLHKINLDIYFPKQCISKEKKYKYIKSHQNKFEHIFKRPNKGKLFIKKKNRNF